jgi:RNA polymerase sigma-70 factor (ECF subfamily)
VEQFLTIGENPLARYREHLRAQAKAWLGPRPGLELDASDVVQEALLKAHRSCEQFRGQTERELAAWLQAILHNTLANALRSADRHPAAATLCATSSPEESGSSGTDRQPADEAPPPEEVASLNEQLLLLARSLARLPDEQRQVVEYKHLHGLSIADICEHTGRTKASVVGLLYRGMKALRVLMDGRDEAEESHPLEND